MPELLSLVVIPGKTKHSVKLKEAMCNNLEIKNKVSGVCKNVNFQRKTKPVE